MRSATRTFDLTGVEASQERLLAAPRAISIGGAILFVLIDARIITEAPLLDSAFHSAIVSVTLAFSGVLLWVSLVAWAPGPIQLELRTDVIRFSLKSGRVIELRWDDPALDASVVDFTSIPWGRPGLGRPVPEYFLGVGPWRSFALTTESASAILAQARELDLSLSPGVGGGTLLTRGYGPLQTHIRGNSSVGRRHT
jgi:hypothetical protein